MVHPAILSAVGMDINALYTVTAFISGLATITMGFIGKVPIVLAPGIRDNFEKNSEDVGMGTNAFFAFTICGLLGVPWQTALGLEFVASVMNFIVIVSFYI